MNRTANFFATVLMLLLISTGAVADNTQSDTTEMKLLGVASFRSNTLKLDRNSRKEIDPILRKLMKLEERRVIKIQGDFATAKTEEQYVTNSLLMSQEVEQYLTGTLGSKHEILVAASKFVPTKSASAANKVAIYLLPSNLKIEVITHERLPVRLLETQPLIENEPTPAEEAPPAVVPPKAKTPEEIAAEKKAEEQRLAEERQLAVDIQKADELVAKERARAVERDKKLKAAEEFVSRLPNPNEK